ncbi:hypothetical protein SMKI_04G4480 [Saccharomyces mikatae IFO 1815]|uniref:YDR239C-like protein n=1 Tax=Saccharomyces mikatae IFO 1815 TaxID=226126 RepID=A0AA35IX47_SACMI|nr:uncharacterized protein SMKI_04G4480 [Saccharomyces mikatae IFO 1815]CAI4038108.1 hypothetical protein SMKI_04G4480 [Saccharomyces mikatae IFO 1815]
MFDSFNNSSKSKRRSFFRFGSESKNNDSEKPVRKPSAPPIIKNSMDAVPTHRAKTSPPEVPPRSPNRDAHVKSRVIQAPLQRGPLKNINPFLNSGDTSKDSLQLSQSEDVPRNDHKGNEHLKKDGVTGESTNPFTTDTTSRMNHSNIIRSRPPPPPVDMKSIKTSMSNNIIKEDLETNKDLELDIITRSSTHNQHRRQRSEAEKLVEDIEVYINEHKRNSSSSVSLSTFEDSDDRISQDVSLVDAIKAPVLRNVSVESSLSYVKPLIVDIENTSSNTNLVQLNHLEQLPSNIDDGNDRFSFTTSASGKSTKSLQQVAKDESGDFKPAHFDFVYKSNENLGSDESFENTRKPLRITNEVNNASSNEEEDSHQERHFGDRKSVVSVNDANDEHPLIKNDVPTQEPELANHPRVFRVVNEDRPSFFLNGANDTGSLVDQHSFNTTTSSGEYDVPLSISNQSELLISKSSKSSVLSAINSNENIKSANRTSELNSLNSISESLVPAVYSFSEQAVPTQVAVDLQNSIPTAPSERSVKGSTLTSVASNKSEKSVPLVSSYVEELRLKYYKTSNFLQAPPNLPVALKQKNNLIQPKNIKVKLRTSSKQIGIKHGKVKQKLLALETRNEDTNEIGAGLKNNINVDHTKEFHKLLGKENEAGSILKEGEAYLGQPEDYLKDIPGDEAYNSDDIMAPLREKKGQSSSTDSVSRSNTVVSYYTRSQNRMRSGTLDNDYVNRQKLPTHISLQDYRDSNTKSDITRQNSTSTTESDAIDLSYSLGRGLRVANPDSDPE